MCRVCLLLCSRTRDELTVLKIRGWAWVQFHFTTPIAMTANAYIWFAFASNDGYVLFGVIDFSGSGLFCWNYSMVYADGFSNPYGTIDLGPYPATMCMYGVLTTTVPGTGGECPVTPVTVKYDKTNAYDAAAGLAKLLGQDFWSGTYFNIGVRNSCVLALPFEDGSGYAVTDVSGHGNHGAIYPVAGNWTFGRTGTGNEDYAGSANTKYASIFTPANTGYLSKITVRCKRSSSGLMRAALYADSAGAPGALIAQTLEATVGTSMGWVDFPFYGLAQPTVTSGTAYWLAISSAANFTIRDQSGAGPAVNYKADTYSDGYANPFGAASTTASKELCMYASGSNPAPTWVDGRYGKALSFNGTTSYVSVASTDQLNIMGNLTISAWVKLIADEAGAIVDKNFASGGYMLTIASLANGFKLYVNNTQQANTSAVVLGVWYHVVAVVDGVANQIYLNNVAQTSSGLLTPTGNTTALTLGKNVSSEFPNCVIDEVMVFQPCFIRL